MSIAILNKKTQRSIIASMGEKTPKNYKSEIYVYNFSFHFYIMYYTRDERSIIFLFFCGEMQESNTQ